mmetsp:Transcript_41605/g.66933  ORF Transcript_41605/g.66933 Transcript_41605/m.66933 type:complete len:113 (-) Transcript_41605:92-430(-)
MFKQDTSCSVPQYCVTVSNTGNRAGHETLFVFVYPPSNISSSEPASKMIRHLIEFEKYYLEKGESSTYRYDFNKNSDLILYNANGDAVTFPGQYTLEFSNGVDQSVKVAISA